MEWKLATSNEPIMVKRIITDIVDTIGPIELSENTEKQIKIQKIANELNFTVP